MKTYFIKFLTPAFFLVILTVIGCSSSENNTEKNPLIVSIPDSLSISEKLEMLPFAEVTSILPDSFRFQNSFKIMFTQPIDHNNTDKGSFTQKVYVNYKDFTAPVVITLDGYSAVTNAYTSELSDILDANHIHVEHRFFGESTPDSLMYEYLNIKQAANDHHRVISLLKNVFKGKWISTGISKGGQTTMYHKRFYPNDVDASVVYVAPLNLDVQDNRIYEFLDNVGNAECRAKILDFQRTILKNREEAIVEFERIARRLKYDFDFEIEKAFELAILEFEFAFWQWGGTCEALPDSKAEIKELVNYLFRADAPGFFTNSSRNELFPFFYQAYTQQGLYGYRIDSLKDYLRVFDKEINNYYTFIPENFNLTFDPAVMLDIKNWLDENGNNMIYIYGENDSWSATAYTPTEKTNSIKLVKKNGSHLTRLQNMPEEQQQIAIEMIKKWIE
jgi:hypothetical protein